MCPDCPHCAASENPCMDYFGSNATPMGGSAGRCDAMVGAIEAQKAEGVLHVHAFYFFQCASQFLTLAELGQKLQEGMLSTDAFKEYVNYSRCASYPDAARFEAEKESIEKDWPAYAEDSSLSRLPSFFWNCHESSMEEWTEEFLKRQQHCFSRMNHHIHPVVNKAEGTRRPLQSCLSKGKQVCKSDFPF